MSNYHVVKKQRSEKWSAKKAGSSKASGLFSNKQSAAKAAKKYVANSGGGEVRIHDESGKITYSNTVKTKRN